MLFRSVWVAARKGLALNRRGALDLLGEWSWLDDAWLDGGLLQLGVVVDIRELGNDVRHVEGCV